jgi:atypical dual specificity phosphatase
MINLSEEPLLGEILRKVGILTEHIPVVDFTAPTLHQVEQALAMIDFCLDREMPVAVHCIAGLGRTGTILACYLVGQGISAEEAITTIRQWRPGSIEISEQEAVIYEYERLLTAQV